MFARINHELSEREALEQARQGLLKKKQSLIADNKKRKEDLASLDKDLETFIDVSFCLVFLVFFFTKKMKKKNRTKKFLVGFRCGMAPCARMLTQKWGEQAAKPIQKIFEKQY